MADYTEFSDDALIDLLVAKTKTACGLRPGVEGGKRRVASRAGRELDEGARTAAKSGNRPLRPVRSRRGDLPDPRQDLHGNCFAKLDPGDRFEPGFPGNDARSDANPEAAAHRLKRSPGKEIRSVDELGSIAVALIQDEHEQLSGIRPLREKLRKELLVGGDPLGKCDSGLSSCRSNGRKRYNEFRAQSRFAHPLPRELIVLGTSPGGFQPDIDDDGRIIDFITGDLLEDRPEEHVRQRLQWLLHSQYGYQKNRIAREVPVYYGRTPLMDAEGNPVRADVAVFRTATARAERDQGAIELVCETKKPTETTGHNQLVSYIFNTSANGAVWYNNDDFRVWRRVDNTLHRWPSLPRFREAWDSVGRRRKSELSPLVDARATLRRCHDRIHRRGMTDDVALTMVRILLAKWRDEERAGDYTEFYCTPEEYDAREGREAAAARVEQLFIEVRDQNRTVFDEHEQIGATADEIVDVIGELQNYRLLGEDDAQWDIMGAAYEQYTADEMKKEGGEFFTNRLIVNLLTQMVNVGSDDVVVDPAGGTGGFCAAALRLARRRIRKNVIGKAGQERAIAQLKNRIFLIDKRPRLVKLAKAAMIVSGNGHRGFFQGDSLLPIAQLPEELLRLWQCRRSFCRNDKSAVVWSGKRTNHRPDDLRKFFKSRIAGNGGQTDMNLPTN